MKNSKTIKSTTIPSLHSIKQLFGDYQLDLEAANRSPKTMSWYMYILNKYVTFLESHTLVKPVNELGRQELRQYIAYLKTARKWPNNPHLKNAGNGLSPHSIQGHVRAIKAFWSWLTTEGYIKNNPLAGFPLPKVPLYVINTLTNDQLGKLLGAIDRHSPLGMKYYCIILLLLDTGMRIAELVAIKINNIDFRQGFIKILGKGQKEREVPISRFTKKALLQYIVNFRQIICYEESPHLFPKADGSHISVNSVQQYIKRIASKVGLNGIRCSPHVFRHTFATQAIANEANVFALKGIMGHTSLQTTMKYTHLQSSDLKAQHDRFSPVKNLIRTKS